MATENKAHSEYGMSNSERWMSCPKSISLCKDAPPSPDNPAAVEGTHTHTCFEALNLSTNGIYKTMERLVKEGHPHARVKRAEKAYWKLMELRQQFPGHEFHAETRVDTSHITRPGNFGTVDAALLEHFGTLTIADYKNGKKIVKPENNTQGIGYALSFARAHDYNFSDVNIVIIQPKWSNGEVVTMETPKWNLSMKELRSWEPKFKAAVKRTLEPNPKVVEGSYCYFCPAKDFNCPAHKQKAAGRAYNDFVDELDFLAPRPKKNNNQKR